MKSDNEQANTRAGFTLALPIDTHNSLKLSASTGITTRTGSEFSAVGVAWQYKMPSQPCRALIFVDRRESAPNGVLANDLVHAEKLWKNAIATERRRLQPPGTHSCQVAEALILVVVAACDAQIAALVITVARSPIASKIAQNLAKNLRLFGWIAFWLQLVLALICGVLLEIATSGRAFSPAAAGGFGDAIYWGVVGFLLLWLAIPLAFYCTRAARKILARPNAYLNKIGVTSFWFLLASLLIGFLGVFIAFIGVALSISLLIVKTVSQPPGIAITDPSKIVRALDVFILIVNYDLLIAHFIGLGTALWLVINVPAARLKYISASRQSTLPSAPSEAISQSRSIQ